MKDYGCGACLRCQSQFKRNNSRHKWCAVCAAAIQAEGKLKYSRAHKEQKRLSAKEWAAANPERARATKRLFREKNPDLLKEREQQKYQRHGDKIRKRAADWYAKNRDRVLTRMSSEEGRKYSRERMRVQMKNPANRLHSNVSRSIRTALKTKGRRCWESLVGYSLKDLMRHLERQFLRGMSWSNMGEWHIDHIVPRKVFSFSSADDPGFKACWAITNLRPLWSTDNIRKHANRTHLL